LSSLEIRNLDGTWGKFRLSSLNLSVEASEYMMLLGPTGSGKTLLLETIAGFHKPDSGAIYIDEMDVTFWPPEKRNIGYVPQNQSLFPNMTVQKNIEFGLKMHKYDEAECTKRAQDFMNLLEIDYLSTRRTQSLSGGEKQKVALARALVLEPRILLLDEPMSNVDTSTRKELMNNLYDIHKSLEVTIIHVTHNHEEAGFLGERIGILLNGKFRQIGETHEIYEQPMSHEIARFLGFDNIFNNIEATSKSIQIGDNTLFHSLDIGDNATACGWRREKVKVSSEKIQGKNVFKGIITDIRGVGASSQITVDTGFKVIASQRENYSMGDHVYIQIPPESIFLWQKTEKSNN
jgi:molybdate/tungstate transport system ATP-binding protein